MILSTDLQKIKVLIFDIDGTLTDGRAAYLDGGEEIKFFDHHDMHWLKMAVRAGLTVGTLSAADAPANRSVPCRTGFSSSMMSPLAPPGW